MSWLHWVGVFYLASVVLFAYLIHTAPVMEDME